MPQNEILRLLMRVANDAQPFGNGYAIPKELFREIWETLYEGKDMPVHITVGRAFGAEEE